MRGTDPAVEGVKPLLAGLMERDRPPGASRWPPNLEIRWNDCVDSRGSFHVPDYVREALDSGAPFRIRPMAGRFAPPHVRRIARTFEYVHHQPSPDSFVPDMPRWWVPEYVGEHDAFVRWLAGVCDGHDQASAVFVTGASFYAEPCIHSLSDGSTRANLIAAGWDLDQELEAQRRSMRSVSEWFVRTRAAFAFNPYKVVTSGGDFANDVGLARRLMEEFRQICRASAVLQNNSIRSRMIGSEERSGSLYRHMKEMGPPLSFQTATAARVGDLDATIEWAIRGLGAHAVELPRGYERLLSPERLADLDAGLKANARP